MSLEALPQADVELIEELGLAMTPEGTASHLDVMTAKEGQDLPDFRRPRHAELQWLLSVVEAIPVCLNLTVTLTPTLTLISIEALPIFLDSLVVKVDPEEELEADQVEAEDLHHMERG